MTERLDSHEDLARRHVVGRGSDRGFGIVFAVAFAAIALYPLLAAGAPRWWAAVVAAGFAVVAVAAPRLLKPLNALWFRFGEGLHRVVSPLVLGLIFYLAVAPTGLLMRLFGKDPLRLRFEPDRPTYWIPREPPGPAPDSMRHQF